MRVVVVPLTSNTGRQYPGEALVTLSGKPGKTMAESDHGGRKNSPEKPDERIDQDRYAGCRRCDFGSLGDAQVNQNS